MALMAASYSGSDFAVVGQVLGSLRMKGIVCVLGRGESPGVGGLETQR